MGRRISNFTVAPTGFLLLDTVPAVLALRTTNVLSIVRAAEWNADSPLPLSALVPINFAASEPARVLRIGCDTQSLIALISGKIRVEYLQADALLSMPFLNQCGFKIFSDVVLADGRPSALVVDVDALLRVHRELGR